MLFQCAAIQGYGATLGRARLRGSAAPTICIYYPGLFNYVSAADNVEIGIGMGLRGQTITIIPMLDAASLDK